MTLHFTEDTLKEWLATRCLREGPGSLVKWLKKEIDNQAIALGYANTGDLFKSLAVKAPNRSAIYRDIREAHEAFEQSVPGDTSLHDALAKFFDHPVFNRAAMLLLAVDLTWSSSLIWYEPFRNERIRIFLPEKTRTPIGAAGNPYDRLSYDRADLNALHALKNTFNKRFKLGCQLDDGIINDESTTARTFAEAIDRTENRYAAVVVLGSKRANPVAAELLAEVANRRGDNDALPIEFKGSSEAKEPGIYLGSRQICRRHTDAEMQAEFDGCGLPTHLPFKDCGILLIDDSAKPVLIWAAGHGGHGTAACFHAMQKESAWIDRQLLYSFSDQFSPQFPIGKHRFIAAVDTDVRRREDDKSDRMEITGATFWKDGQP